MPTPAKCHLLVGLPSAGKTTFLAAFWYVVKNATSHDALRIQVLPDDQGYLNGICDVWMKGKPQQRTPSGHVHQVSMRLVDPATNLAADIVFPDLSGEMFGQQWAHRQWAAEYDALARTAAGMMLFIHPQYIEDACNIADIARGVNILTDGAKSPCASGVPAQDLQRATPWDPLRAPTQVVLIDLVQFMVGEPCWLPKMKVCVVVSAWDLVERQGKPPGQWLKAEMALLYQYLTTNIRTIEYCVFGVSAQGGDLGNEETRKLLLDEAEPAKRIRVFNGTGERSDITMPIRWLQA